MSSASRPKDATMNVHLAAWTGNMEVMETCFRRRYDFFSPDTDGWTTLHLAVWNMHVDVVVFLLDIAEEKTWVSQQIRDYSALHFAAWNNDVELIKMLLKAGAGPSRQGDDGSSPMHSAARNGHADAIKALKEAGADK